MLIRLLRFAPRRRTPPGDLARLTSPRILLVRHDRIGDALVSTPIIALLRERFPDGTIDIVLGEKNRVVAPLLGGVDEIFVLPTSVRGVISTIRSLRARRYDAVINLLAKDSASGALVTAISGAAVRIGFAGNMARLYDVEVARPAGQMHMVRVTSLLLEPFGIAPVGEVPGRRSELLHAAIPDQMRDAVRPSLDRLTGMAAPSIIMFNISGTGPARSWVREKFIRVAMLCMGEGFTPVIVSAPRDAAEATAIAAATGALSLPAIEAYAGFAAMLDSAAMIVTPDTSIVHLSAALGKPTVMLSSSHSDEILWGPWGVPRRVVVGEGTVAAIEPETVMESIRSLAAATRPAHYSSSAP